MSEQIGWLCYTETGARHFIWKADDAEEQAWLDKHYPRREPVYTGPIAPEGRAIKNLKGTDWDDCRRCGAAVLTEHPEADPSVVAEQRAAEKAEWQNAKRYRFLRDGNAYKKHGFCIGQQTANGIVRYTLELADKLIDEAMAESQPQERKE